MNTMTTQEPDDTRPVTITTLTKAELMNGIGAAASIKSGLSGEYNMVVHFRYAGDGELIGAEIEQRAAPPGSTGQPPMLVMPGILALETNAQRIVRETPQWSKDICERSLAEAAAGPGGQVVRPATENSGSDT